MGVRENLAAVHRRIDEACRRAGRAPEDVRLLPVSKAQSPDAVRAAYDAGERIFGENKAQEGADKAAELVDLSDLRWAMIGHLQTNKARQVVEFASEFHALDSTKVAAALERRLTDLGRTLDVFVQVNSSGEDSKFGLPPDDVPAFVRGLGGSEALRLRGLMTLAVFSTDEARVRACFETMRRLQDRLRDDVPDSGSAEELSMGMSNDFELAIEYGATTVRVGEAIFGARLKPQEYWPGQGCAAR